ncbi:MAG: Spy/CpxP family protein refolding chaperone [Planctomycetaceae bacterium]
MCISRFVRQICAVVTLAVVASSLASAQTQAEKGGQPPQQGGRGDRQGGRGGFGGFGGFGNRGPGGGGMTFRVDRAMLLGLEQIRTELKVEESQAAVIDSALDAYREERNSAPRPDRDAVANMSEEERTKMFEDMQKQREELSRKTDEVLNALLEPAQVTRLDQISLQMRLNGGLAAALKSDDLKAKLKISEEQIAKLDAAETSARDEMQKMMEEMRASFQGGRGPGAPGGGAPGAGGPPAGFEAMREKMEAARKKTSDAAMAVLTDAQKTQLEELKGAAFEIDLRAMMGGRGGFGGQGGPGGPGGPGGDGGRGQGGRPRGTRPQTE